MENVIKHITKRLVNQLPEYEKEFKLSVMLSHGFPKFVVMRIQVELERNLAESILLPETEWANMESDTVRKAWEQFVSAIRAQARLPQSYAQPVIETAISDIVEILVQPRKNLPDVIFGADDTLQYNELVDRLDAIVVYRHFASLLPRYMEKKQMEELDKELCAKIIAQADEKLVSKYTPLNWAQMLEPLFILMEGEIDSNMLRLFFEDKNMPRLARQFDLMSRSLNRSELIEVLSSPGLPDDDEQNVLFEEQSSPPESPVGYTSWEGLVKTADREREYAYFKPYQKEESDDHDADQLESEGESSLNTFYSEPAEDEADEPEEEEEQEAPPEDDSETEDEQWSLNDVFAGDELEERQAPQPFNLTDKEKLKLFRDDAEREQPAADQEEADYEEEIESSFEDWDSEDEPDTAVEADSTVEEFVETRTSSEPESEDTGTEVEQEEAYDYDDEAGDESSFEDQQQDEDGPIWQKFISSEEHAAWKEQQSEEDVPEEEGPEEVPEEEALEEEGEQEPLIDFTKPKNPNEKRLNKIKKLLEDDRERFVDKIFKGGEEAYEQALEEIAAMKKWRRASHYIDRHIFKRNLVDMYSEAAVDFTDQLQNYFTEETKSNQQN